MLNSIRHLARSAYRKKLRWFPGAAPVSQAWLDWMHGPRVPVQGFSMRLDAPDSLGLRRSEIYEPLETRIVLREVREGMRVLDLGANIGYYTLLMARAVGPSGQVIAIEADPSNFAILTDNVAHHSLSHTRPTHAAAAAQPGVLRLYQSASNRGDNRLYDDGTQRRFCEVPAVTVDSLVPEGAVDFIKMDIQGGEAGAFAGMCALLERSAHVRMLTEYWPEGIEGAGGNPEGFLQGLVDAGFVLSLVEAGGDGVNLPEVKLAELNRERCRGGVNLLCVKGDAT